MKTKDFLFCLKHTFTKITRRELSALLLLFFLRLSHSCAVLINLLALVRTLKKLEGLCLWEAERGRQTVMLLLCKNHSAPETLLIIHTKSLCQHWLSFSTLFGNTFHLLAYASLRKSKQWSTQTSLALVFWYLASKSMWCESRRLINSLCSTPLFLQTHLFKIRLLHFVTKSVYDGKEGHLENKKESFLLHLSWPYLLCVCAFCPCSRQGVRSLDNLFCLVTSEICAVEQCNSKSRQVSETVSSVFEWGNCTLFHCGKEESFQLRFVLTLLNILGSLVPVENSNTHPMVFLRQNNLFVMCIWSSTT